MRVHISVLDATVVSPVCVAPVAPPISTCRVRPSLWPEKCGEDDLLPADQPVAVSCVRGGALGVQDVRAPDVRLAGDEQLLCGKRVVTWLPSFATTTSSSIRAAERPSVAAQ